MTINEKGEQEERDPNIEDFFLWHRKPKDISPNIIKMALDLLSIPAMSTECERAFSCAKRLLSPLRNRISKELLEALMCLGAWYRRGLFQ